VDNVDHVDDLARLARDLTDDGTTPDEVARELMKHTTFPIAVIKAIRAGLGLPLAEAKTIVHRNLEPAAREQAERMWDELLATARGTPEKS
jgi:ribosomal protein L7/L12